MTKGNKTNHPSRKGVPLKGGRTAWLPGMRITPDALAKLKAITAARKQSRSDYLQEKIDEDYANIQQGETEMSTQTTFINKTQMKKVNKALEEAGFSGYPGDRTTAHPNGSGSGYVSNLVEYIGGQDHDAKNKVLAIVRQVLQ